MSHRYSNKYVFVFCSMFLLMTASLFAQSGAPDNNSNTFKKGFYVGIEMGAGWLQLESSNQDESREGKFIMGFYGGYRFFYELRAGVKIDGYLIEASDYSNPAKGIGISNTSFQVQVFPLKTVPLFVNFQYGWSRYSNNHPLDGYDTNGTSQKIGLGYEYNLNKHFDVSLITNYGFGKFDDVNNISETILDQNYNSWDITLCLTYH